jgi:hypothetical protein
MLHGFTLITVMKATWKELRPRGHRAVEFDFSFACNKTLIAGWGFWLRDAGRGLQNRRHRATLGHLDIGKPKA